MSKVSLGPPRQTARPLCLPVEFPEDFDSSSQYGLDLLFEASAREEEVTAASEGGREPSDTNGSSELASSAAKSQSVADAEIGL
ncbi:hypothetical protein M9458_033241, partial [Cirrhinus mrigala]